MLHHTSSLTDDVARVVLTAWCDRVQYCPRTGQVLYPWDAALITVSWPDDNIDHSTIMSGAAWEITRERMAEQLLATRLTIRLEVINGRLLTWPPTMMRPAPALVIKRDHEPQYV